MQSAFIKMKRIFFIILALIYFFQASATGNSSSRFNFDYKVESYGVNPSITPEEIKRRLEALPTQMEMKYTNDVQSFIDRYMKNGRKSVISFVVKASYYLPIFEQALREAGLPEELKYLPIIESGLNPHATSPKGAAGLWQFMAETAKGYDMTVSNVIDERRDPYISSERACVLLKHLYDMFGDWNLVLAAYNAGPGRVKSAIARSNSSGPKPTFWEISRFLPTETQKYVPMFIAINYVMNYYTEHNVPEVEIENPFTTDTIHISHRQSIKQLALDLDIMVDELKALNPQFRTDLIPATPGNPCNVILPYSSAVEYKEKHGRPVSNPNMARRTSKSPQKLSQREENRPVMASTASSPAGSSKDKKRRDNWNDEEFENVPSKSMPGVYIRVKRNSNNTEKPAEPTPSPTRRSRRR